MGEHVINNPNPLPPGITFIYPYDTTVFDGINFYLPSVVPLPGTNTIPYFYKIANWVSQDVIKSLKVGNQPVCFNRALRSPTYMPKYYVKFTTDIIFIFIYVTDKINKLHINSCIKEKIINMIFNNVDNLNTILSGKLDMKNPNLSDNYEIDNDKIYYIPNYVNQHTNTNIYPLNFLLFVRLILHAYYNIGCCCKNCDHIEQMDIDFYNLCKFVFSNLCVIDVFN